MLQVTSSGGTGGGSSATSERRSSYGDSSAPKILFAAVGGQQEEEEPERVARDLPPGVLVIERGAGEHLLEGAHHAVADELVGDRRLAVGGAQPREVFDQLTEDPP